MTDGGPYCPDGRPCYVNVCKEPGCFRRRHDSLREAEAVAEKGGKVVYDQRSDRFVVREVGDG